MACNIAGEVEMISARHGQAPTFVLLGLTDLAISRATEVQQGKPGTEILLQYFMSALDTLLASSMRDPSFCTQEVAETWQVATAVLPLFFASSIPEATATIERFQMEVVTCLREASNISAEIYLRRLHNMRGLLPCLLQDLAEATAAREVTASLLEQLPHQAAVYIALYTKLNAIPLSSSTITQLEKLSSSIAGYEESRRCDGLAEVFSAAVTYVTASVNCPAISTATGQKTAARAIYEHLLQYRTKRDLDWHSDRAYNAYLMVVLEALLQDRQKHAPHAGHNCAVKHVCDFLAQPETLPLFTKMLVKWPACQTTAGLRDAIRGLLATFSDHVPLLLLGLAELLKPESNCKSSVRCEALQAMHQILPKMKSDSLDSEDVSAAERTLEVLLHVITCDTAVTARRAALQCLPMFQLVKPDIAGKGGLLAALALKCRDRDSCIRRLAFQQLCRVSAASLVGSLTVREWQDILSIGLMGGESASEGPEESKGSAIPGAVPTRKDALLLMKCYLEGNVSVNGIQPVASYHTLCLEASSTEERSFLGAVCELAAKDETVYQLVSNSLCVQSTC